eukprot:CAMPEP_0174880134 /NCGR_PEP_ID=MMETSP1114-20130205/83611_1 /TAXON_ID=312471 /ORGANISM="Neobodo designis, Strain CCAP 1951/1" /LENGTH=746 /DNA_ID=CAMNT_0016115529 /DNA_START=38 /DNA_END=2275 /DNA_ORIENTATION=-
MSQEEEFDKLLRFAREGQTETIYSWFRDHPGSDVNAHGSDKGGSTLLYCSARAGHLDTVKMLIDKLHADVNCANLVNKSTPLHGAAYGAAPNVVQLLLECGACTEAKNTYGEVPLTNAKYPSQTPKAPSTKDKEKCIRLLQIPASPSAPTDSQRAGTAAAPAKSPAQGPQEQSPASQAPRMSACSADDGDHAATAGTQSASESSCDPSPEVTRLYLRVTCKDGMECPDHPGPGDAAAGTDGEERIFCPFLHLQPDASLCRLIAVSPDINANKPYMRQLDIFGVLHGKPAAPLAKMYRVQRQSDRQFVFFAEVRLRDLHGNTGVCIPAGYVADRDGRRLWYDGEEPDLGTAADQKAAKTINPLTEYPATAMSFSQFFRIGAYDVRVLPERLSDVYGEPTAAGCGWRVDCTPATWAETMDEHQVTLNVSITGHFNVGKTWLVERLTGLPLPTGATTHTEGLCFVYVPISEHERLCIADQVGQNSPSTHLARSSGGRFGRNDLLMPEAHVDGTSSNDRGSLGCQTAAEVREKISRMQVRENFFSNAAMRFGNVYVHVVGSMRHHDQLQIHAMVRHAIKENRRVDIFVVHNLKGVQKDSEFVSYVERVRDLFALRQVGLEERLSDGEVCTITRLDSHMDAVGISSACIQHLFLKCELPAVAADGRVARMKRVAWNKAVIGYLRRRIDNILGSRREGTRARMARVLSECQRYFAQPTTAMKLPRLDFVDFNRGETPAGPRRDVVVGVHAVH